MSSELPVNGNHEQRSNLFATKAGLARMLKGGVIMDVVNAEQVCSSPVPPSLPPSLPAPPSRRGC